MLPMRLKSIFGSPSSDFTRATTPQPVDNIDVGVEEENPQALAHLYELMGKMPERGKVGTRGKIGSFLMSLGGRSPEEIDEVVQSKYHTGMRDFTDKANPLLKAAQIESTTMNNKSLANYRDTQGQAALGRVGNTAAANAVRARASDAKIKIDEFKSRNPGDKVLEVKGGNYMLVNPVTGAKTDTGIKTGTMTEEEKQDLINEGRMDVVERQGMNTLANTQLAGQNAIATRATAPGGTNKADTPTQAATRLKNNLQNMRINKPNLVKWVEVDGDGNISVTPASADTHWYGGAKGPSEEEYKEIVEYLSNPGSVQSGLPPQAPNPGVMTGGDHKVNQTSIGGNPPAADKRTRAIEALKKAGKIVNEDTIAAVMTRIK